jgi:hypothetical protein
MIILVMRRRYLFTIDDVLVAIMFMTSLSLYLALDYKKPIKKRGINKKDLIFDQDQIFSEEYDSQAEGCSQVKLKKVDNKKLKEILVQ